MPVQSPQLWMNADPFEDYGSGALAVDSQSGTTIGNGTYTIESILGQGGMGIVYAGVHNWTGRPVAIKVLRREVTDGADEERVLQEARAATAVAHPNVVEVLDMGREPDGRIYLVFERLDGETLADVLDRDGVLSPEETAEILLPVLDALAMAHDLGIVHRDLKPENIFLAKDATGGVRPKLLDFGLAKMQRSNAHTTATGVISGTPSYMSPERAMGKRETGVETDVWSMGVVLFECLTNRLPFHADHPMGILLAVVSDPVPSLQNHPLVTGAVADVVDAALSRDVVLRLPDAAALRDALANAVGRESRTSFVRATRAPMVSTFVGELGAPRLVVANDLGRTRSQTSLASVQVMGTPTVVAPEVARASNGRAFAVTAGVMVLGALIAFWLRGPDASAAYAAEPPQAEATLETAAAAPAPMMPVTVVVPAVPEAAPRDAAETAPVPATRARPASSRSDRATPRGRPARGTNGVYILD